MSFPAPRERLGRLLARLTLLRVTMLSLTLSESLQIRGESQQRPPAPSAKRPFGMAAAAMIAPPRACLVIVTLPCAL